MYTRRGVGVAAAGAVVFGALALVIDPCVEAEMLTGSCHGVLVLFDSVTTALPSLGRAPESRISCICEEPTTSTARNAALAKNSLFSTKKAIINYAKPGKKSLFILNRETPMSVSVFLNASTMVCGPEI